MASLQNIREKAKDTKATLENLDLKEKIYNAQSDLFSGWRNIADRAKKEAKSLNKKARKALATYEEGSHVRYDQIYDSNFDTGFDVWRKFQKNWIGIRDETMQCAKKAEVVDMEVSKMVKDWRKWDSTVETLHNHLVSLPDIIGQVEIAQNQICSLGDQILKINRLMLDFEEVCELVELEKQKSKHRSELSDLVEKRQLQFQMEKEKQEMSDEELKQMARIVERQDSIEKQQIYKDAFLEQMERYKKYGELEKPIAGSVDHEDTALDVSFEEDLNVLKEFLGPEELDGIKKSHSAVARSESVEDKTLQLQQGDSHKENLSKDSQEDSGSTSKEEDKEETDEGRKKEMKREKEEDGQEDDDIDDEGDDDEEDSNKDQKSQSDIESSEGSEEPNNQVQPVTTDNNEKDDDVEWFDAENDGQESGPDNQ
eukprot:gene19242-21170_t